MYWIGRLFQHTLNSRLGILVPVESPNDVNYEVEGVTIHKFCLRKLIPHSRFSKRQLHRALSFIEFECKRVGLPDWFIGHWDNPQLELLDTLKKRHGIPTCLVLHDNVFNFEKKYGINGPMMLANLNVIGFRSMVGKRNYEAKYGKPRHSFIASSGVSSAFLDAGVKSTKIITHPIRNFIFVGALIARKYPSAILTALSRVYPDGNFTMIYVGDGAEKTSIEEEYHKAGSVGELIFTGRIPRDKIIDYLKLADVFVMISSSEIFGLVYLEAMALGLIPIGSKDEGIDGVICDGQNGFLCKAGNVDDLSEVLERINRMSCEQVAQISQNAKQTALMFSDECVAQKYIDSLIQS